MLHLPRNIIIESLDDKPISIDNHPSNRPKSQTYPLYKHINHLVQKNNQSPLNDSINQSKYYQKIISKTSLSKDNPDPESPDITHSQANSLLMLNKATENDNTKNDKKNRQLLEQTCVLENMDIAADFDEFSEHEYNKNKQNKLNISSENHALTDGVTEFTSLIKQSPNKAYNYNMGMKTPYSSNTYRNPFLTETKITFELTNQPTEQSNNNETSFTLVPIPIHSEYKSSAIERLAPLHDEMILNKKGNIKRIGAFKLLKRKMSQR